MKCPKCKSENTAVMKKYHRLGNVAERDYHCLVCGNRFYTKEKISREAKKNLPIEK